MVQFYKYIAPIFVVLNNSTEKKMLRSIIKIDEKLCNGCGICVTGCHEGALQIIDSKARLISELFCDGLGACLSECPMRAITIEEREAEPYDEIAVIERMIPQGKSTILAHLKHLKEHNETEILAQAINYLKSKNIDIDFSQLNTGKAANNHIHHGCPGGREISFKANVDTVSTEQNFNNKSQLRQWPVQMHLLNPEAGYFKNADVVLAADCVAYSFGDFHRKFLANKALAIACPKLDSNIQSYIDKLRIMINNSFINTLTVVIMEVPCCTKLLNIAMQALAEADRKIPVKVVVVGIQGDIIKEEWI